MDLAPHIFHINVAADIPADQVDWLRDQLATLVENALDLVPGDHQVGTTLSEDHIR